MDSRGFWSDSQSMAAVSAAAELGDYQLLKRLGSGALGDAYLAEHRLMKRPCVVKILPTDLVNTAGFLERFETEVARLAQLEHPHLARLHNIIEADGRYGLVTDAIVNTTGQSTNLAQWLQQHGQRLSEDSLYHLLLQVAEALDTVHKHSFHGGIKLNNILIRSGQEPLDVALTDIGVARILGWGNHLMRTYQAVVETITGDLGEENRSYLQTWAFMAPEQRWGRNEAEITGRVDAYSFGVLTYYLLTGEVPEGIVEFPAMESYRFHWEELVRSCLQRDPLRRPPSLVDAMRHLTGEAVYDSPQPVIQTSQLTRPTVDLNPELALRVDSTVRVYQAEEKQQAEIQAIPTEMIVIPAGRYWRGSADGQRDEIPRHQINLSSYAIDVHPVTNEQFVRFLTVMGGEKDLYHRDLIRLRESRIKRSGGRLSIESGYQKHPVVGVTWYGAFAYAKWVGKRLPTEAEWEVATAGAGQELRYPTGSTIDKNQANYFSADTTPIGIYPPTALGLFDVAGNVYEWCHDWYDYNSYEKSVQEPDNPKGPVQGVYRVLRGGCWKSLKDDLRCSRRHRNNPGTVNGTYGFRCAADVR